MTENGDRRALLAIVLSLGVYFLWSAFFAPPPPVQPADALGSDAVDVEGDPDATAPPSTGLPADRAQPPAVPPPAQVIAPHEEAVSTPRWSGAVRSEGGGLTNIQLAEFRSNKTVTPLWEWGLEKVSGDAEGGWAAYQGGDDPYHLLTTGALGIAGAGAPSVPGDFEITRDGETLTARGLRADGLAITTTYAVGDEPYTLDLTVRFDNGSGAPLSDLWVGVTDVMGGDAGRFLNNVRPLAHVDGGVEHVDDLEDLEGADREVLEGPVEWFGVGDRYFMAVLIPDGLGANQVVSDTLADGRTGAFVIDPQPLDAGATRTMSMKAYIGPKDLDLLKPMGASLDEAVEFGWFGLFSRLLLFLLEFFQGLVVNWGVSIILLTFLVKLTFFPLTQKAFTSSRKMQALQPKLNAMREKYKDNKELQTQETMKLFKEHKVNPMGGCLPTLIQFPVWIALYNVMLYSVELYDTQFLYLQDLTECDPYGVVPTAYAVLMFLQQRMMPTASLDETQQKVIKMMPLIFAFFMYSFPSGLVLYFCVNMMLTIVQQWFIKRKFPDVPASAPAAG